jgi:branched-chain amino acid transport system substrate-binding protein
MQLRWSLPLLTLAACPPGQGVIKIGEINSYKAQPAFLEPYKKGMELAVEQVNAAGGIAGKKLQLIVRDDNATPAMPCVPPKSTRAKKSMCSRAAFSRMWAWH